MNTLIRIDASTRAKIGEIVMPFIGQGKTREMTGAVSALLARRFPKRRISVLDMTEVGDTPLTDQVRLMVICDGEWDQGIVVRRPV